jgi:hypothetical protein
VKKIALLTLAALVVAVPVAQAGQHIVGGTKYTGNTIPWWGSYTAGRFHCMWFQSEINEGGAVSNIEFQVYQCAGGTFNSVDMLLCHSNLSALTSTYSTNYAGNTPTKVYTGNYTIPSNLTRDQWFTQCEPTNFTYNNKDNLLFEISWEGRTSTGANYFWRANTGQPGRVWASSKTASSGSLYSGQGEIARLTIGYEGVNPTSLGRVKSIFK